MTTSADGCRPVLVGVGLVTQRGEDPTTAREPLDLMVRAARAAGDDCDAHHLLRTVDVVYVPRGRWQYSDPGRAIAQGIGAPAARSVLALLGVLQDSLIAAACERIAAGEISTALIVGGDAGHRLRQARLRGHEPTDSQQDSTPDEVLKPSGLITTLLEEGSGLGTMPVGYYAIIDSAERHRQGISVDAHRDAMAGLYSGFSRIAAGNPHAWKRSTLPVAAIREASETNPMLAFPYTKHLVSNWSVDQAVALLLCSSAAAAQAGVPRHRWIYPRATAVSEHMVPVSERACLPRSPGAELAARRALDCAGLDGADLGAIDIYSCFPVAVRLHAAAVGIDVSPACTLTGGMPFAGGPLNNAALGAVAQLAERLRKGPGRTGLVSSVSGVLTKHGFGIWSTDPGPGYGFADVTAAVACQSSSLPVVPDYQGNGTIAGYTVLHRGGRPQRAIALIDTDGGRRALAWSENPALMSDMIGGDEFCHRRVTVTDGRFIPSGPMSPNQQR